MQRTVIPLALIRQKGCGLGVGTLDQKPESVCLWAEGDRRREHQIGFEAQLVIGFRGDKVRGLQDGVLGSRTACTGVAGIAEAVPVCIGLLAVGNLRQMSMSSHTPSASRSAMRSSAGQNPRSRRRLLPDHKYLPLADRQFPKPSPLLVSGP